MNYRPEEHADGHAPHGEPTAEESAALVRISYWPRRLTNQLESLKALRKMMASVTDKEAIAPPVAW